MSSVRCSCGKDWDNPPSDAKYNADGTVVCPFGMITTDQMEVESMQEKAKSVLDNIPVEDKAFPLGTPKHETLLEVVGNCPRCGAPVYAKRVTNSSNLPIRRTCKCFPEDSFENIMQTK